MRLQKMFVCLVLMLLIGTILATAQTARGQSADQSNQQATRREDDTNLDTQLYLIVASNQDVSNEKMPVALDAVMKQLHATLPFKSYKIATTLINRVKNDGRLSLRWVGGPMIGAAAATVSNPTFNEFHVNRVKLLRDADGQAIVRMEEFGFGARIPVQTLVVAANGPSTPITNYENTGLNTDISMREGEPVVIGTLNVGTTGEAIILVMSAKRAGR